MSTPGSFFRLANMFSALQSTTPHTQHHTNCRQEESCKPAGGASSLRGHGVQNTDSEEKYPANSETLLKTSCQRQQEHFTSEANRCMQALQQTWSRREVVLGKVSRAKEDPSYNTG